MRQRRTYEQLDAESWVFRNRWKLIAGWIMLFTLVAVTMYQANRNRIADIQRSRVESCVRTYEGVRQVFVPFQPPVSQRTPEQDSNWRKFNRRIAVLKSRCEKQTDTGDDK